MQTWSRFVYYQAGKRGEEFLYDTYEKELWIMSYGLRIKKDRNCIKVKI